MTSYEFVEAIKKITQAALSGLLKTFVEPPGRKPAPELVRISNFFKSLSDEDKKTFTEALELTTRQSACNFLSVLDGALAIESTEGKGQLELYYSDGKSRMRINAPDKIMLNEIFRQE